MFFVSSRIFSLLTRSCIATRSTSEMVIFKFFRRKLYFPEIGNSRFHKYLNSSKLTKENQLKEVISENSFYHDVLLSNKMYSGTVALKHFADSKLDLESVHNLLDTDFVEKDTATLLNNFKVLLSSDAPDLVTDKRFGNLCNCVKSRLNDMSDDEIICTLQIILLWPDERNEFFFELCKALDYNCLNRFNHWGIDRCLFAMDHFYRLRVVRYSEFVWTCIRKLSNKLVKMPPKQFVHLMFIAGVSRQISPTIRMYHVECAFEFCLDELSADELAIICSAFFKTETKIRSLALLEQIYFKVSCALNVKELHPIALTSILKFLRYCTPIELVNELKGVIEILAEKVDHMNLMSCVHAALLGTQLAVFNEKLLKKASVRLVADIADARIKDIERILLTLAVFHYRPTWKPCVFQTAMEALEDRSREPEILSYPRSYVSALNYLALFNLYSHRCVDFVFSSEFMDRSCGKSINKFTVGPEMLFLSNSVTVECPDYAGNRLSPDLRKMVSLHRTFNVVPTPGKRKLSVFHSWLVSVKGLLAEILGDDKYVHMCCLLPHFPKANIIFCLRDELAQVIPSEMLSITHTELACPPNIGTWYAVELVPKRTLVYDSQQPFGIYFAKMRQLKQLKYIPLLVKENEWDEIPSEAEKKKFLSKMLKSISSC